nr:phage tail protein [uncultured Streptococcus sp.]
MITFVDEKGTEHSALVAYSVTNAVNGELSVKGTIYTNDKVLHGIGRGWRFRLDDEYYRITYAKPNDTGRQIEVEFDAVHQFFYDMSKSMVYTTLNGSKPFETYLQAIFSGSGYTYNLETTVGSIRKENFGNKSRLSLFNDIIKTAGLEFSVRGHVVRILKRIGTDLSTIVRKDFNMNELKIEKDINSFVTYQRGLGAWKDDEDHSKGRYESEYESPLAKIYGRIEADPVVDERYKDTGKLLERLKENVDKSYKVSVEIDMEDLSQAGYRISRPNPGDYIMAINETLGFRQKVRIVSFTSEYDVGGKLISRKVVCNDIGTVQRATSEISHLSRTLTDSIEGSERALKTATRALVSADGKNTNYFGDVKPLDVPKGSLRKGDRLFLTVGDKKQLYFWNGAEWELEPTEFDHEKFDMEFNRKSQEIIKTIQENRRKAEEALRNSGASSLLAQEAKRIGLDSIVKLEAFKSQATSAQAALSGDLDALKRTVTSEVNQASEYRRTTTEALSRMTGQMNGFATKSEVRQDVAGLTETFAKLKTDTNNLISGAKSEITLAKTEFKKTADGLSAKMSAVESYVGQDGQRQEDLQRYTREESARQATAVRELVTRDYVGKSAYQEDVRGLERRFSAISTQTNNDIATKIAQYKQTVDGQFANITSQMAGKVNQTDFQQVRETSQLYERIIGSNENDISNKVARMALTNQLFQVEVGKYANVGGPNMLRNSRADDGLKYWTEDNGRLGFTAHVFYFNGQKRMFSLLPGAVVKSNRFLVKRNADYILNILGFDNNSKYFKIYFCKRKKGVTSDFEEKQLVFDGRPLWVDGPVFNGSKAIKKSFKLNTENYDEGYLQFEYDRNNPNKWGGLFMSELDFYEGTNDRLWQPAPEDAVTDANAKLEAIRTQMTLLQGSWSVQNLTSAGSIVSQINATNNQILIEAEKIRLKGKTLLDELTAIQGYFKRLFVGEGAFATLNTDILRANSITADKLVMDQAMARMFVSSDIFTDTLAAKEAFINKLRSVVVSATLLEGYKGKIGGFQIGTHDKDPHTYWLTGQNQFYVGMSNGGGSWGKTALWVNWGTTWDSPGKYAWFVKESGEMHCHNTAHFWSTPIIHGDLRVGGNIYYINDNDGYGGYWTYSSSYKKIDKHDGYIYFYDYNVNPVDWIPLNKEISDRRYKHNIQDSQVSALDVIERLKTYSYRKEYDGKIEDISCGIMAQDVQKYVPEAFYENPDGAYSYRTFELVPYLIKAIQELNQKIQKLEKTDERKRTTNQQSSD